MRTWGVAVVLLLSLVACGDDSGDDDDNKPDSGLDGGRDAGQDGGRDGGGMDAGDGGSIDAGAVTFSQLYSEIFMVKCLGCHSVNDAGMGSGGLALAPKADAVGRLVGVNAAGARCADAGLKRVVANQPDMSLLYLKLGDTPPCGARMPLLRDGGTPNFLNAAELARVRAWIQAGAKND